MSTFPKSHPLSRSIFTILSFPSSEAICNAVLPSCESTSQLITSQSFLWHSFIMYFSRPTAADICNGLQSGYLFSQSNTTTSLLLSSTKKSLEIIYNAFYSFNRTTLKKKFSICFIFNLIKY